MTKMKNPTIALKPVTYPTALKRFQKRRAFMTKTVGIQLPEELLPMSNFPAAVLPYLLMPEGVIKSGGGGSKNSVQCWLDGSAGILPAPHAGETPTLLWPNLTHLLSHPMPDSCIVLS